MKKAEVETPAFQTHYLKMYHYETNPEMMPLETVGASSFSPPVNVNWYPFRSAWARPEDAVPVVMSRPLYLPSNQYTPF
jgi:hypothetical protein